MPIKIKYIILLLFMMVLLKNDTYIVIKDSSHMNLYKKIEVGDTFVLSSKHSVSGSLITEEYLVTDALYIKNTLTRYYDQGGAGLPDSSESIIIDVDGSFVVHQNRVLEKLLLYVDKTSENNFTYGHEKINLSDINTKWLSYELYVVENNFIEVIYFNIRMWLSEN